MRIFLLATMLAASLAPAAVAQPGGRPGDDRGHHDGDRGDRGRGNDRDHGNRGRGDGRGHDDGRGRGERIGLARGNGGGDWQRGRQFDWNRPDPRYGRYDATRYYRAGGGYQERRLGRGDRIYRGSDNRYYCRRSDGTTGLIIGGVLGGVLGNSVSRGGSTTLATLLGAAGGAALGSSIDRGNVRCR